MGGFSLGLSSDCTKATRMGAWVQNFRVLYQGDPDGGFSSGLSGFVLGRTGSLPPGGSQKKPLSLSRDLVKSPNWPPNDDREGSFHLTGGCILRE